MATPAFAKDEAPKCTPAAADKLADLKQAVTKAERAVAKAQRDLDAANDTYAADTETYTAKKNVVDAYNNALKNYNDAKTGDKKDDTTPKQLAALKEAVKTAAKNANKVDSTLQANEDADANAKLNDPAPISKDTINQKKVALENAKSALEDAKADFAKAQCKDVPADPDHKDPTPTPAPAGSKAEHVAKLYGLKSVLDDAEGNMNGKLKTYHELFAKLSAAKAEMDAAKANLDAADQAVKDALAAGLNDSNPSAYKDLTERAARALAHYLAAQKTYNEVKAEFDKAYAEAVNASAAYNKALEAYKKAINAALADGVKLPGDLPVLTDPLAELNLPVPAGVPTPVVPGQPGKPGKPEVEKKKNDGKKLPGTGVGVTLTALAATMLAGMGAAVRKARH
ncbi:hypothetical protein [Gardnerella vaginalis]|uniref:Uncharacterized protein n=1 Tax=Gardnerella vaginalis TaxID=2702 RepID=A0A133NLW8_GARVA|nr:hypothetical protein [Gardnerella vaginalis]KXA17278.1 hypothetical protein HMPREF3216_01311 [Gardnerella vaginalis]